jgi:hypothetical protein
MTFFDEMAEKREKATEGLWETDCGPKYCDVATNEGTETVCEGSFEPDAAFIAACGNITPAMWRAMGELVEAAAWLREVDRVWGDLNVAALNCYDDRDPKVEAIAELDNTMVAAQDAIDAAIAAIVTSHDILGRTVAVCPKCEGKINWLDTQPKLIESLQSENAALRDALGRLVDS